MLVISGQVKRETYLRNYPIPMRQLGDQEVDIVSMAQPVVKYATVLQDPLLVGEVMDKAIFLATYGRPGPVWVDVPVDIQGALIDPSQLSHFDCTDLQALAKDPAVTPNTALELKTLGSNDLEKSIALIIERLKKSKFPAIMAGSGVRISGMHPEFLKLIETLKIPVVTGWNSHDVLENAHACYAGRPGTVGNRTGNFVVQNADFLLVLGCRLNIRQVSYNWKSFANKAWIAMVDVDEAELKKPTLDLDLPVQAKLEEFIPAMQKALSGYVTPQSHEAFLTWAKERLLKYPTVLPEYSKKSEPVNPYIFIQELFAKLNGDDIVVAGNGSACVIGFQAADLKKGQRLYTNSGNASMGYDLPAAIGAAVANNKKRVVCLAGDGSLMMNLQELQTVVGYKLPIKIVILNNEGYHSIRQTQEAYFSDSLIGIGPETGVSLPNFIELGKAFQIPSKRVSSSQDLSSVLDWFLGEEKGAAILEVMLDIHQTFSPKLASRKLPDGTMVSPSLEDMAPFLSREELNENIINP